MQLETISNPKLQQHDNVTGDVNKVKSLNKQISFQLIIGRCYNISSRTKNSVKILKECICRLRQAQKHKWLYAIMHVNLVDLENSWESEFIFKGIDKKQGIAVPLLGFETLRRST